jgi:iron complex transport system permease protein
VTALSETVSAAFALHRRRNAAVFIALGLLVSAAVLLGSWVGAAGIGPKRFLAIFTAELGLTPAAVVSESERAVLLFIRLPRVALGLCAGAALAVSGAVLQGLFRNPLADPGLIGVSTGAALAAVAVIVFGGAGLAAVIPHAYVLPVAAFAGGIAATVMVYRIARRDGATDAATLLLAGVALNALTAAGIGALVFASTDQQLRDLSFWMLGSLGNASWRMLTVAGPAMIAAVSVLLLSARFLDAMLLGEGEARHLGFDVEAGKRRVVLLAALATGGAVALTGVIGFVGLVVPHLVRLVLGPTHRLLLPASALLGAALLVIADLIARTVVLPAELPIGIVTSCVGGPLFLWLLTRRRAGTGW